MERHGRFSKATSVFLSVLLALNLLGVTGLAFAVEGADAEQVGADEPSTMQSASSEGRDAGDKPDGGDASEPIRGDKTEPESSEGREAAVEPGQGDTPASDGERSNEADGAQTTQEPAKESPKEQGAIAESDAPVEVSVDEPEEVSAEDPTESSAEESEDASAEEPEEASVQRNAEPITGALECSGVTVQVSAPEGSFTEGTIVSIDVARDEENRVGFDITFFDANGVEAQPEDGMDVSVSFSIDASSPLLSGAEAGGTLSVYHENDGGAIEVLKEIAADGNSMQVEVAATHFSEYGVAFEAESSEDESVGTAAERSLTRAVTSTDLAGFLTDVIIDAPLDENGNYVINPNSTYEMTLEFSENEGLQFDDEQTLTYDLPEGIRVNDVAPTFFSITVTDENGTAVVEGNTFEVVDGQLRVHFNQDDPNFDRLKAMPNVNFGLSFSSSFDQAVGEIVFNANVIKDFVFEEKSDLTIDKNVIYDMDADTASYTLTIRSEGINDNVIVEDHLTGTALIFNEDVVVESSVNGVLSVAIDYDAVENGFRVTIPQTVDKEVLTLRYTATVDNTKISSNGTVEQTNNTARVTSDQVPDGKEASADFAGQADFQRVSKNATGEPVEVGENLYQQTWTIMVNEDHRMAMGGADIDDWIVKNSRPFMHFDGVGLTINVTFENGATESRIIPWSDLHLWQDDGDIWGWKYTTPESDGKASYEITCTTLIDTSGALGDLTLVNGAQVYGSYDEGQTTIGVIGENVFGVKKEALGTTSTESDWAITVTVPGSGLPEMHVTDDAPKLTYEGQDYIDALIEDSFEIEGLLEGESWSISIDGSNKRSYTLTFYKNGDQIDANKGLLPTPDGQKRDIVIRFKTAVNQDWLNLAANDGYESPSLYRHRNYAAAWSGSYRTQTVNATVIPIKPNLVKNFIERSETEIDGVTYPVFRYSLSLYGPVEDGIVLHDAFNTDYLGLYEDEGVAILGGMSTTPTDGNGTASATSTADGIDITVASFPKQANGAFYPYYEVSYALVVKDQAALEALNAAAAASQGGVDLENTATWNDLSSSRSVNYTYFPYVDKELLTRPTADNGYIAEFEVIINKYAEDLDPTSDTLTIQDELSSNLRFIPDSLIISPANDSITVQHDAETNTLTFDGVPDETTFVITYQARVLGSGNVTYSNTIKFGNFEKTVEENTVVDSSGTGSGSNPSITIVKRDSEDISQTLAGATFQLFYIDGNGDQVPVKNGDGEDVTFTTGADGSALIVGNLQNLGWTLWAGRTYCLVEVAAPTGYELNAEPVCFVLSETPSSQMEFDITGDKLSIQDDATKTSVPVTKDWIGPVGADAVTVHLLADEVDTGKTITLSAENEWSGSFDNLRKYDSADGHEIVYDVQEDSVNNYDTKYEGTAEEGITIVNTNTETIEIPVYKTWIGPAASTATVKLMADGVEVDSIELTAEDDWQHTFADLPKYDSADGHEIVYDVQEDSMDGYEAERSGNAEEGFAFTNTNTSTIDIPVTKTWVGPAAGPVTIKLTADGTEIATLELSEENGWTGSFEGLPAFDPEDGHEISYDAVEDPVEDYSSVRSGTSTTGFSFTNTIMGKVSVPVTKTWVGPPTVESVTINLFVEREDGSKDIRDTVELDEACGWQHTFQDLDKYDADGNEIAWKVAEELKGSAFENTINADEQGGYVIVNYNSTKTSVSVSKKWIGPAADSVSVQLLADGEYKESIELSEANGWKHEFSELPKYDDKDGHEIAYTVEEEPIEGYEQSISGNAEDGYVITNANVAKVSVSGLKKWDDAEDKDGLRPDRITVHLLADGVVIDSRTVTADDSWAWSFGDLPRFDSSDGNEIVYELAEDLVAGYTATYEGDMKKGFTITNTHKPSVTPDNPNADKPSPTPRGTTTAASAPRSYIPKTGDDTWKLALALIALSVGVITIAVCAAKMRKRDGEDIMDTEERS